MKTKITVLLIGLSQFLFGQKTSPDRPELIIDPNPFQDEYFKDHYNYTKTKEIIGINKKTSNNFQGDTMFKNYYRKDGQMLKKVRYSANVPKIIRSYKYDSDGILKSWVHESKGSKLRAKYYYDSIARFSRITQYNIRKRKGVLDSNLQSDARYFYQNNRISAIESFNGIKDIYSYKNQKLVEKTGAYIAKTFDYNNQGHLIEIREYMGGKVDAQKLMGIKKFYYNSQNQLICDSILTSANFESNTYQITHYEYDINDKLSRMEVKFGASFCKVNFEYQNNRISNCELLTNDINRKVAYLRFPIPSGIPYNKAGLVKYREVFSYDENGNKTGKEVFVDDALFFELEYLLIPF
tara:strand:- start:697 stop:1752 length:1056 start_codon:yes stop_codon:yes gene_type:complete